MRTVQFTDPVRLHAASRGPQRHGVVPRSLAQPAGRSLTDPGRLRISEPADAEEIEADTIARRVIGGAPSPSLAHRLHSHHGAAGPLPALQAQRAGSFAASDPAAATAQDALRGEGQPLDLPTRTFFEPRFGRDLSSVRVHTDSSAGNAARGIGALAYTLGSDVAFAPGKYQPASADGRTLIAHELAHVVQQETHPAAVRRKIKCDPRASLAGFLSGHGVKGFTESNGAYDRARSGAGTFEQEVLIDMLSSPRVFHVDGDNDASAGANLAAHVRARTGIVTFAARKQYNFAALSGWKMNPAYYDWDISKGTWKVKPGVDPKVAWEDVNINPTLYAIGCAAATDITLKGGSGGATIIDLSSADQADWVAGDAGYIENTKYPQGSSKIGLLGENIIYTGSGMFWGHFTGSTTYRTLAAWIAMVTGWNGGAAVDAKREMPATGLLDK